MQIKAMEDEHLDEIIDIDESTFNRVEPRSIENLKALKMSDPKGCFVITDKNRIIGYNYSKTTGNEGYMGPLGIINDYQNKGLGKALMEKSINYLCKKCKIIGLEVLPENGNVIGLYQRIGFTSGFPSFLFQVPEGFKLKKIYSNNFRFSSTSEMTSSKYEEVLEGVEKWTQSSYNGVSYRRDLSLTHELKGEILVAFNGDVPAGFLAYSKTLLPTLWGAVNGNITDYESQKDIMKGLLYNFDKVNGFEDVVIQINSRHNVLVDMMMEMGFRLYRSVNRMYLKGFEGDHLKKTDQLVMRPWRG
jgi:GNAT superfamily N-acetyltransferase